MKTEGIEIDLDDFIERVRYWSLTYTLETIKKMKGTWGEIEITKFKNHQEYMATMLIRLLESLKDKQ